MISETEKAYIAAIIDGEGSIFIGKTTRSRDKNIYYTLWVTLCNTSELMIDFIYKKFGGYKTYYKNSKNNNKIYRWAISKQKAKSFLKVIMPYLIVKKDNAILAIEFQDGFFNPKGKTLDLSILEKREKMRLQMKALNHRIELYIN